MQTVGLELLEHIIRLWKKKKLCLKAFFFRPDIESSIKLCHKTSLNWNFSWRNDKVIYLATEGKSSLEVKGWNVF